MKAQYRRSWQPPLSERIAVSLTLVIEFWRCEMDNRIEIQCTEEGFDHIVAAIEKTGIQVEKREIKHPEYWQGDPGRHRLRAALRAVHEVQGIKWEEGADIVPAIESLVTKYAERK